MSEQMPDMTAGGYSERRPAGANLLPDPAGRTTWDLIPVGTTWGDESEAIDASFAWARRHLTRKRSLTSGAPSAAELSQATGETVTAAGIGSASALKVFDEVLLPATCTTGDPMNVAYVPAAPTGAALAFDMVTSAANIFAGMWEVGAGAIHAENQVLAWLVRLLDWPATAGGCFVAGGTQGNLSALVAARSSARARRIAQGLGAAPAGGWVVACSEEAHFSIRTACSVMDVELLTVPADPGGRLTGPALEAAVAGAGQRDRLLAVVACAGTTTSGAVDDLAGIAGVCAARDLWLHVDGAYGGAALAAPSTRDLFDGIQHADSFVVDPHKWLFAPYDCCALVYRRPEQARAAHTQRGGVVDLAVSADCNPADLAIHLTRRPRGLPLWFSLATHGTDAYGRAVETSLETARTVAQAVTERPYLRLVQAPQLSIVLLERVGWSADDHAAWADDLADSGDLLCRPVSWHGRSLLRLAFTNPDTDPKAVISALDTLAAGRTGAA